MRDLVLHEATGADGYTLAALIQAAFEEYRGTLEPPLSAHSDTADLLREKMATAAAVLAKLDGEPTGCVFYQHFPSHTYLGRLAVLPEHRGSGIGRALIQYVEAEAREAGKAHVQLGTRLGMTENRTYYLRQGYKEAELGTHPGFAAPTFIWLEKWL